MSAAEMQRLFGPRVCSSRRGALCVLSPPASQYLTEVNKEIEGGHCYGFSVLSLGLFKNQFAALGPGLPFSYSVESNVALQRSLAYAAAFQFLDRVTQREIKGTPNEVLGAIEKALSDPGPQTYTLAIFQAGGTAGHAVTPFGVVDHGGGAVGVQVYDNNHPGETREVSFNTNENTWRYNAALNPSVPPELYGGTAAESGLELKPTTPGLGVQPCPFCRLKAGASLAGENIINLTGDPREHAHLLIRNRRGQRTGVVNNDQLVNEIPGARIEPVLADDTTLRLEPNYLVPERPITIAIDGRQLHRSDTEAVSSIGPGRDVALTGLRIGPGQQDLLSIAGRGRRLSLRAARGQQGSPTVQVGLNDSKVDYSLAFRLVRFRGGSTLHLALDTRRRLLTLWSSANRGAATFDVSVARTTHSGRKSARHLTVHLRGAQRNTLSYT